MLSLQTIFQNDSILVEVDEGNHYLQTTSLKQPTSEDFRSNNKFIATLALEKGIQKALFDIRKRNFLDLSDQNWLIREIVPLFKGKHVKFAYLTSLKSLELMDTYRVQEAVMSTPIKSEGDLVIEHFIDKREAKRWLLE